MSDLAKLLKPVANRAAGPSPTFGSPHIVIVLLAIGDNKMVGRGALAKQSGLGDGAIRTLIKRLKDEGYITVKPAGCTLTAKGADAYSELRRRLPRIVRLSHTSLTLGSEQVALLVKGRAEWVKSGIEQRDAAIKAGAEGATTYVIRASRFQIPGASSDCEKDFPGPAWPVLRGELKPVNGDAVIVCGSGDQQTSLVASVSSALTLLN